MDDKIIVKGKTGINILSLILLTLGLAVLLIGFVVCIHTWFNEKMFYRSHWTEYYMIFTLPKFILRGLREPTKEDFAFAYFFYCGSSVMLSSLFTKITMRNNSLTVTNEHVFGRSNFGKTFDLPITQVTSVTCGRLNNLSIATSAGKMRFYNIINSLEVKESLAQIVNNVQVTHKYSSNNCCTNADELRKYKELLDGGVISQEEFDAKKKQLLGL